MCCILCLISTTLVKKYIINYVCGGSLEMPLVPAASDHSATPTLAAQCSACVRTDTCKYANTFKNMHLRIYIHTNIPTHTTIRHTILIHHSYVHIITYTKLQLVPVTDKIIDIYTSHVRYRLSLCTLSAVTSLSLFLLS